MKRILDTEDPGDDDVDEGDQTGMFSKANLKNGFKRAATIFGKVFQVIWKFSEFFMPMATSIPFVGSGVTLLTKAIELLIVTTKNYRAIFAKAGELFEQVGFFSMRFEMLMEAESAGAKIHAKYVSMPSHSTYFNNMQPSQFRLTIFSTDTVPESHPRSYCRLCRLVHRVNPHGREV